ncbi:MOSC N-terminal beta barrel domain-containing protein [Bosea sp. CCNWLW174]|uniref:MOSC domain-containing protein n=1 Tax=unclassified Bosea (in: a-proteobacteria) TaxID=2653178 RepID=UPI0030145465
MSEGAIGERVRVSELWIYPVKGLRGIRLETADLEPWGLRDDRRFMIVDANDRFLTQREEPRLATISATLSDGKLLLQSAASQQPAIEVARPTAGATHRVSVVIWRDMVSAVHVSPAADRWLSAVVGRACRLVYMDRPEQARPVDAVFGRAEDRVSFADGFPLLVTNRASQLALAAMPGCADVTMQRFRPNVVVEGPAAWAEDHWRMLTGDGIGLRIVKPCARCVVTTIDQETAVKSPEAEPLRSMATFRRDGSGKVIFGQNAIPDGTGRLSVGDVFVVGS